MKNLIFKIAILGSILGCENGTEKQQTIDNQTDTKVFHLAKYAPLFKYKNLKTFDIDTIQFGEREKYYNKVDSLAFESLFQGHETFLYSNAYFFYANFDNVNKVALIEESDEFGVLILLITFDDKGKFITKSCLQRNTQ
jgi:hypothetical protein